MLMSKTQKGHKIVITIMYNTIQAMPLSIPVNPINFLPSQPQRLPPVANVISMSTSENVFTFHLPCNFFNMLQNCGKTL